MKDTLTRLLTAALELGVYSSITLNSDEAIANELSTWPDATVRDDLRVTSNGITVRRVVSIERGPVYLSAAYPDRPATCEELHGEQQPAGAGEHA